MDDSPQHKAYARCGVCMVTFSTHEFKLLSPCGHFLCNSCINTMFPSRKTCPFCRAPITKESFRTILLDIVPASVALTDRVIEGLDLMNENAKLVSVLKTPAKLKEAAESLNVDQELAHSLKQAITEFKERLVPLFKERKEQKEQIDKLHSQLEQSKSHEEKMEESTAKLRSLEDKVRTNRKNHRQMESERDKALEIATRATNELTIVRDENEALKTRLAVVEKEIDTLKGSLQHHKAAERKSKVKKKEMQHQIAELESKLNQANKTNELVVGTSTLADSGYVDLDDNSESTKSRKRSQSRHTFDLAQYSIDAQLDFEGMPGPGFSSDWTPNKRLKAPNSKVKEITNFPIELDKFNRLATPAQLGPKRKLRVPDALR
ncbi:hypothetical protein JOM56_007789 [Amanita muscaria]